MTGGALHRARLLLSPRPSGCTGVFVIVSFVLEVPMAASLQQCLAITLEFVERAEIREKMKIEYPRLPLIPHIFVKHLPLG